MCVRASVQPVDALWLVAQSQSSQRPTLRVAVFMGSLPSNRTSNKLCIPQKERERETETESEEKGGKEGS